MSRDIKQTIDDDLRDAVEEDVRASLIMALQVGVSADDAEEWLGLV